ncbi:hypothetical protein FHS27_003060 [Rhodopirellula rubra]|uniref:Uncharacterized protein n=1 Tax=Aporhodopirellula rubra TaxID=980271 RepID=A0A7W5DZ87_9BACT|nr:hypothetical protein [Aporhodopirellula rubra]
MFPIHTNKTLDFFILCANDRATLDVLLEALLEPPDHPTLARDLPASLVGSRLPGWPWDVAVGD